MIYSYGRMTQTVEVPQEQELPPATPETSNYFEAFTTVESIKKAYRDLAFKLHPDVGGTKEAFTELNRQYEAELKACNGQISKGEDGTERTYNYRQDLEREIIEKIDQIIKLKLENVDTWLIGLWIWIQGETKPYKDEIKGLGFKWSAKHTSWYWRREQDRTYHSSGKDLAGIAATYGASKITSSKSSALTNS